VEKLLSSKAACELLSVRRTTLYKIIKQRQLRSHFIARAWKFRQTDLEAYLERMAVGR
jgi:excisionase family DNA binding protein